MITTMSRLKPSHGRSSSQEIRAGPGFSPPRGRHHISGGGSYSATLAVPKRDSNSRTTQCPEDLNSYCDSFHELRSTFGEGQFCGGLVFKASPSRRQVKAVIFERGPDGEPTVTVVMTRDEPSSSAQAETEVEAQSAEPETQTYVTSPGDQTFKIHPFTEGPHEGNTV